MNRTCFHILVDQLAPCHISHNNSNCPQAPVEWQLAVALRRFGMEGNGVSVGQVAGLFKLSEGAVEQYTWRVIGAIIQRLGKQIQWPDRRERKEIASKIGRISPFIGCVGFIDGTLIPINQRPGLESADDFYCRKSFYAMNVQVVVDLEKRITHIDIGWSGATNDQRVFDWSDVSLYSSLLYAGVLPGGALRRSLGEQTGNSPRISTC